jgi:hypothetical protein
MQRFVPRPARRAFPRILAVGTAVGLAGCSSPQHVYSTDPVDRAGQPLAWERVRSVELESGETIGLRDGELVHRQGDRLVLRATAKGSPGEIRGGEAEGWPLADLRRVEIVAADSRVREVEVFTPEDLWAADEEPRVELVELRDGTKLELDPRSRGPRLDLGGAAVSLPLPDGREQRVPLADVRTLVVTRGSFVGSTLRSPATWLVVGATAGVLVLITATHDDANDAVK